MNIKPSYGTVASLFRSRPMFFVPKYQRAYAWEAEPIADFIKDLEHCIEMRKSETPVTHFLGGILSIEHIVEGVISEHEYEIIDGQQRIATLTLLSSCLIETYKTLATEAHTAGLVKEAAILKQRVKDLSERFIDFELEVHNVIRSQDVLRMSKADRPFYRLLVRNTAIGPFARESHKRLFDAYLTLDKFVKQAISGLTTVQEKINELKVIETVFTGDFTVIHMVVDTRKDAYTLFQVMNDRGTNLTDGDLLRARTLEVLEAHPNEQGAVEELWDEILIDPPSQTNSYLNWIYESCAGSRAPQNALYDKFLEHFFPTHYKPILEHKEALEILQAMRSIFEEVLRCRKLEKGQWLYEPKQPISGWDLNRLNLLLVELNHTLAIPLLLAAAKLDHKKFSEIVQMLERTFFRYKLICNQHPASLKAIYLKEALAIRSRPNSYSTSNIKSRLEALLLNKAPDKSFSAGLAALQYQESSNQPLKYFLMTVEYYYQWYKIGAAGQPACVDKSRVYDFSSTSIEHIYPHHAEASSVDVALEPVKQTLGNLTIMDPKQNALGGNKGFVSKQKIYSTSSFSLTQEIGRNIVWTSSEISTHQALLINIALKIFLP